MKKFAIVISAHAPYRAGEPVYAPSRKVDTMVRRRTARLVTVHEFCEAVAARRGTSVEDELALYPEEVARAAAPPIPEEPVEPEDDGDEDDGEEDEEMTDEEYLVALRDLAKEHEVERYWQKGVDKLEDELRAKGVDL